MFRKTLSNVAKLIKNRYKRRNFLPKYCYVTTFYRNFVAKSACKENFCYLGLTDCTHKRYYQ